MAGRGRGRGRGLLVGKPVTPGGGNDLEEKSTSEGPQKVSLQVQELENRLHTLAFDPTDEDLHDIEQLAIEALTTSEDIKKIASLVYARVVEEKDFSKAAALVCEKLCSLPSEGTSFRTAILASVQGDFKNRETLLSSKQNHFLSCFSMLIQLFGTMRLGSGEVMQPLVSPIFDCCELILHNSSNADELCECLTQQLPAIGRELQDNGEERMQNLMELCRKTIIKQQTKPPTRCYLLEMLELYLRRWQHPPNEVTRFYCDTISDIFADDVLREEK